MRIRLPSRADANVSRVCVWCRPESRPRRDEVRNAGRLAPARIAGSRARRRCRTTQRAHAGVPVGAHRAARRAHGAPRSAPPRVTAHLNSLSRLEVDPVIRPVPSCEHSFRRQHLSLGPCAAGSTRPITSPGGTRRAHPPDGEPARRLHPRLLVCMHVVRCARSRGVDMGRRLVVGARPGARRACMCAGMHTPARHSCMYAPDQQNALRVECPVSASHACSCASFVALMDASIPRCVCMYEYMYVCTCVCVCVCARARIRLHTYA